jgi:nicotinate-nucleotide--dimethylbenzimidazole phosphoribosyltransferase
MNLQHMLDDIRKAPSADKALENVKARIDRLTMPPRAMGRGLELCEELFRAAAGPTSCKSPSLLLFAGQHQVVEEGVSAFPAEVTQQMVKNFLAGGAAINQLAKAAGADLTVVNVATDGDYPEHPQLLNRPVAACARNLRKEAALEESALFEALSLGWELATRKIDAGADLLAAGEMGIGNTTPSACLCSLLTEASLDEAVGRGTGLDDPGLIRKKKVVAEALARLPRPEDPWEILRQWGGYEHAAIVGVIFACAGRRVPFILDGFNVTAAALVAATAAPRTREVMVASHQGAEPGHRFLLEKLGRRAYLEWDLRLGEGSGAALLFPLCRAACLMVNDMATFEEAAVSEKEARESHRAS